MMMGILGIFLINLFGQIVVKNEQNYYLLKEITEAAMYDALDENAIKIGIGFDGVNRHVEEYKDSIHCDESIPGTIRIHKEKFVESFIRRFSESTFLNRKYKIIFHDIDECPPKVSVSVVSSQDFNFFRFFNVAEDDANIVNSITGILEVPPVITKK